MERATEVVEHVVAAPIDHAALEHAPGETRTTDELLGRPLGAVVGVRSIGPCAKKADHREAGDACALGCRDDRSRTLHVDSFVRLVADLTVDAGAMNDRFAPV